MDLHEIAARMAQSLLVHPNTVYWTAAQIAQEAYNMAEALQAEGMRREVAPKSEQK